MEPLPGIVPATALTADHLALVESAESVLDRVDRALSALDTGRYGTCEACGEPLPDDELERNPLAASCRRHASPAPAV